MKSHINSIKPPQLQLHHSFRCSIPQFFGQLPSKSRGRHQRLPVFARRGDAGATEIQEVQRPQRWEGVKNWSIHPNPRHFSNNNYIYSIIYLEPPSRFRSVIQISKRNFKNQKTNLSGLGKFALSFWVPALFFVRSRCVSKWFRVMILARSFFLHKCFRFPSARKKQTAIKGPGIYIYIYIHTYKNFCFEMAVYGFIWLYAVFFHVYACLWRNKQHFPNWWFHGDYHNGLW